MKVVFSEKFTSSDYAANAAAAPGRMESIMSAIREYSQFEVIEAPPAEESDILLAHSMSMLAAARGDRPACEMAMLAAGGAIKAAEVAMDGEPAFACIRPPGHHASRDKTWDYCVFNNIAVALLRLESKGLIESGLVLDFDAHTGDGTKDILGGRKGFTALNPAPEAGYLKAVDDLLKAAPSVDVVGVSAGFDAYVREVGGKLTTYDFYEMGRMIKRFSRRLGHGRRFAVLEGGYYVPDLGKNVLAFCEGLA